MKQSKYKQNSMNKIYIDCFFYGFWMTEKEASKYRVDVESLKNKTNFIYKNNRIHKNTSMKNLSDLLENVYVNIDNESTENNSTESTGKTQDSNKKSLCENSYLIFHFAEELFSYNRYLYNYISYKLEL